MRNTNTSAARDPKTARRNRAIFFQYILFEMIQANQEIHRIETILNSTTSPAEKTNLLEDPISNLIGQERHSSHFFIKSFQIGILPKIRQHILRFADPKTESLLIEFSDNLWSYGVECFDQGSKAPKKKSMDLSNFKGKFSEIKYLLANYLLKFKQDENVLYFLLKHHQAIDSLYEPFFVRTHFDQFFPKGMEHAKSLLVQKYVKRGFDHLIPVIENSFIQLAQTS